MEATSTEAPTSPSPVARRGGFRPNLARGGRKAVPLGPPGAPSASRLVLETDLIVAGKRKDKEKEIDDAFDVVPTTPQKRPRVVPSSPTSGPAPVVSARARAAAEASPSSPSGPPPVKARRASTLKDVVRANVGTPMAPTGSEEQVRAMDSPAPRDTGIPVVQQALGPQVTIDPETGEFVVDKQSLVVHTVQRDESASYNVVYEDQEGKNTNFQRYRRKNKREKWTRELTDKFYEALRRYGTDFTLIAMLFPGRTRDQIRNKFKKEEKENGESIDLALKSRLPIEENEHKMLAEKAKQIAEEEKRLRELKEKGESDIPPPPTPDRQAVQPRRVPGKTTVIAPVAGPAPEGEPEAAPSTLRRGPDGELVMDRSEYDAQNRDIVDHFDAGRYDDDDGDDYGYAGGNDGGDDDY